MAKREKSSKPTGNQPTQINVHSIQNILGREQQLDLFSDKEPILSKHPGITRLGVHLTDFELRVLEGVLQGFTRTRYKGNARPQKLSKRDLEAQSLIPQKYASPYKEITEIPNLVTSRREIMRWAGLDENSIGQSQRVVEALKKLASTPYCWFYTRLAYDENENPIRDSEGNWKKEEVIAIGSLFSMKFIRSEGGNKVEGLEIAPNPIFLDQKDKYFILIPNDWREEVQKLVGTKKTSASTFSFLLFLRLQYELKRRSSKEQKPYKIKWTPEKIATHINVPEVTRNRKKARMNSLLENAYEVAKKLGYLTDYERGETVDVLWLNEEKYQAPEVAEKIYHEEDKAKLEQSLTPQVHDLYRFIIEEKRRIDPKYKPPMGGPIYEASLQHLHALLKQRTLEEIQAVVSWGLRKPYWCQQIGSPAKLRKNFHAAYSEMSISKNTDLNPLRVKTNKQLVEQLLKSNALEVPTKVSIEVLNKHVEVGNGLHQPSCIDYNAPDFQDQLQEAFKKWQIKRSISV